MSVRRVMETNLVQQIHACKEPRLKVDFGSLWLGKGDGRRHFVGVVLARKEAVLVQMSPSYHAHPAEA